MIIKQPPRGFLSKMFSENMQQFTGEHPCRSVISIKLQSNFIKHLRVVASDDTTKAYDEISDK